MYLLNHPSTKGLGKEQQRIYFKFYIKFQLTYSSLTSHCGAVNKEWSKQHLGWKRMSTKNTIALQIVLVIIYLELGGLPNDRQNIQVLLGFMKQLQFLKWFMGLIPNNYRVDSLQATHNKSSSNRSSHTFKLFGVHACRAIGSWTDCSEVVNPTLFVSTAMDCPRCWLDKTLPSWFKI